jgi:hypothetical protein
MIEGIQTMTLGSKNFTRPLVTPFPDDDDDHPLVTPFPDDEDDDPVGLALAVANEYRMMEDGHHAELRAFLGRAYHVYRLFQKAPGEYGRLKQHPYWKEANRKPRGLKSSKSVLLFLMQVKTRNRGTGASTYAKVLNGFARNGVRDGQVAKRVQALGGVDAAYDHFLAAERALKSPAHAKNAAADRRPLTPRNLLASRGSNDDKVQGEVETDSPPRNSLATAAGGRRRVPSFDPQIHLLVEHEPDALEATLDVATTRGRPVRLPLWVTVYPRDANGIVRVVHELEPSNLPEDFLPDYEDEPSNASSFNEKWMTPEWLLHKRKPEVRPR